MFLPDSDILLIAPPFQLLNRPSLGLHILQAEGFKHGFSINVFYASLCYADFLNNAGYKDFYNVLISSNFFSKPKIKNKISRNIRDFRDF